MDQQEQEEGFQVRISPISVKDVITFVSVAVAITLAWGVFGTRLTLVEKELIFQDKRIAQVEQNVKDLTSTNQKLEQRIRYNEDAIQNLWTRKTR